VSVVDTRTYQVPDTIPLGNFPADVAIDEATHTAYITSGGQVGVGSSAASSRDSPLVLSRSARSSARQFPSVPFVDTEIARDLRDRSSGLPNTPHSPLTKLLIKLPSCLWHDYSS